MVKLQIVEAPAVFFSEPYQASSTGTTCCAEGSWGRPGDTHGALTKLVIFDQNWGLLITSINRILTIC